MLQAIANRVSAQTLAEDSSAGQLSASNENAASTSRQDFAMAVLHRSIWESVWGKPAHSSVRQSISVLGKQMSGVGDYVRRGDGRGALRFSLRFSAGDHLNTLLQVCDGQRLMTVEDIGKRNTQTEVDLSRIRARLGQMGLSDQSLSDPIYSIYLAVGGQAEVLRTLCQRYQWHSVTEATLDGVSVWSLRGTLALQPPTVHGLAPVDTGLFAQGASKLAPTHIEASIATGNADVPYWLHRVVYSRPSDNTNKGDSDRALQAVTEWYSPQLLQADALEDQLFQLPSAAGRSFSDDTIRYLPPVHLASTAKAGEVR